MAGHDGYSRDASLGTLVQPGADTFAAPGLPATARGPRLRGGHFPTPAHATCATAGPALAGRAYHGHYGAAAADIVGQDISAHVYQCPSLAMRLQSQICASDEERDHVQLLDL